MPQAPYETSGPRSRTTTSQSGRRRLAWLAALIPAATPPITTRRAMVPSLARLEPGRRKRVRGERPAGSTLKCARYRVLKVAADEPERTCLNPLRGTRLVPDTGIDPGLEASVSKAETGSEAGHPGGGPAWRLTGRGPRVAAWVLLLFGAAAAARWRLTLPAGLAVVHPHRGSPGRRGLRHGDARGQGGRRRQRQDGREGRGRPRGPRGHGDRWPMPGPARVEGLRRRRGGGPGQAGAGGGRALQGRGRPREDPRALPGQDRLAGRPRRSGDRSPRR